MKLGYFCSEFPALSHTFISREIDILEKLGFEIVTASVNPTRNLEKMGAWNQERAARTFVLKACPLPVLASRLMGALFLGRFFPALGFALRRVWMGGPRSLTKALGYFVQAVLLDSWARRQGIRHIHVHFANAGSTVALIAARLGRVEFSLSIHGPDEFYDEGRLLIRDKILAAVFVRCISHYSQSQLMRLVPSGLWPKIRIVRCGLYKDEFPSPRTKAGTIRNILCVGRVCPNKGQAVLVRAAKILLSRGLDFHFLLLGGGEELETLRELVAREGLQDHFTVAGPVGHERVKSELEKTDLFVLPSFAEGIPVALMEAMAAGVPVVSTGITGIPELIESGVDGFLTLPAHHEQLAELLETLIAGKVDLEPVIRKASVKIATLYDVEKNTRELGALLEGVRP